MIYGRQLSDAEALMNEGKALAEQCGAYVEKLRQVGVDPSFAPPDGVDERWVSIGAPDQRWVSIGATDLQRGFMALMRAIARPTTF